MLTVDEMKAGIRTLVQGASDVYHYGGEDRDRGRTPGYPDFGQLQDDIDRLFDRYRAEQSVPYQLEIAGGVTAVDLRLNFAFRSLTYRLDRSSPSAPLTADATVYLADRCSFLAEAFLQIDRQGAAVLGFDLEVDELGVPTELAGILVRVDYYAGAGPVLTALAHEGWSGDELFTQQGRAHVELGTIPYRNLVFHLEAGQLNAVTYDLAGEWMAEEVDAARQVLSRHFRHDVRAGRLPLRLPDSSPPETRRRGTSRLHGRPLDENGSIELTEASA